VTPLIRASMSPIGQFDPTRFGKSGLLSVRPILSFKILSNMPVCFISICENIQGPNAVYTPWEGQGARAIETAVLAIQAGDVRCAVVGGCDVRTHELAFISLEQHGLFDSWENGAAGVIPGEGAAFLVLEAAASAAARSARAYARLGRSSHRTALTENWRQRLFFEILRGLDCASSAAIVAAGENDQVKREDEAATLQALGIETDVTIYPKRHMGNLFAAAATVQVALAAMLAERFARPVLANCFGYGSEQAAFVLENP